ncbi:saccharopine dehydrogenase family protein [Solimicrobium silvestre]|uniref:Saccharopine dehydrogenase n=1 Tax=Solimicrobium silvestre TaxID=2099400 RepID=A0A2S9GSR1_9BURK|nr:saccharopine dehydrogenase NADP-binding domain-containing protein [Solimicrobium silvestre]PRC90757.1 Saccharopine dehydrogenase [Solimicrobium silvestre]
MHTILVLGGYGFFGGRICHALASNKHIQLFIAGRDGLKAQQFAVQLGLNPAQGIAIDAHAPLLAQRLMELNIQTVIHTAGPFQGQDYSVARAAIEAGANYIDLADGRDFVAGIDALNESACRRKVLVTSGASSLPALSSAVVDRYLPRFSRLDSIQHGIGSGARAPGLATMRGVFGYCGKPFSRLMGGQWRSVCGWLDLRRYRFPSPVGARLLGNCDVPDLVLFPKRYSSVHTVTFQAGFASSLGHLAVWLCAQLVRLRLVSSLVSLVKPLHTISSWMEAFVSDKGAMFVALEGLGLDKQPLKLTWHLVAAQNHGPYIPCGAAIALAHKLSRGDKLPHGAMPCMGLLSVEDYLAALQNYDIQELPA